MRQLIFKVLGGLRRGANAAERGHHLRITIHAHQIVKIIEPQSRQQ